MCQRVTAVAIASVLLCSCGDECEVGEARCDGDYLEICEQCGEPGCTADWRRDHCRGTCVSAQEHGPFCALSDHPEPRCAARTSFCDGDTLVRCFAGYRFLEERCPSQGTCVEAPSDAGASDGASSMCMP